MCKLLLFISYRLYACLLLAEAFVSLATNDEYAKGALALGQSLRETQTNKRLVLMITDGVTAPVG